jgi:hypothetical protein
MQGVVLFQERLKLSEEVDKCKPLAHGNIKHATTWLIENAVVGRCRLTL